MSSCNPYQFLFIGVSDQRTLLFLFTHSLAYASRLFLVSISKEVTYLLTPWSTVLLEKPTDSQLVKKFPAFYGTRKFIVAFTTARHLSLSWARSIQSLPHPTSWESFLISLSHPRLCVRKHKISDRKKSLRQEHKRFFESFTCQLFGQTRFHYSPNKGKGKVSPLQARLWPRGWAEV